MDSSSTPNRLTSRSTVELNTTEAACNSSSRVSSFVSVSIISRAIKFSAFNSSVVPARAAICSTHGRIDPLDIQRIFSSGEMGWTIRNYRWALTRASGQTKYAGVDNSWPSHFSGSASNPDALLIIFVSRCPWLMRASGDCNSFTVDISRRIVSKETSNLWPPQQYLLHSSRQSAEIKIEGRTF